MMQHTIFIARARDAAGDGFAQDAHDGDHLIDDFALGEAAARPLILDGELPQRRAFVAVVRQHVRAAHEGHMDVFA